MKTIILQSLRVVAMNGAQVIFGLISSVILARALGPEARGIYAMITLVAGTMAMLCNPGIYASANYHMSTGRWNKAQGLGTVMAVTCGFAAVAALIAVLVMPLFGASAEVVREWPIFGSVAVITAMSIFTTSFNGLFFGSHRVSAITNWRIAWGGVQCLVFFLLAMVVIDLKIFTLATAALSILDIVGLAILFCWGERVTMTTSPTLIKDLLRYGIMVYGSRILLYLGQRLDTFMVLFFLGTVSLGHYTIAVSFAEQIALLPYSVSMIMMPNLGKLQISESAQMTARVVRYTLVCVVAMIATLMLVMPMLIPLMYGEEYRPSVLPFLLLAPGTAAISLFTIMEPFFQSNHRPHIPLIVTLIGVAANCALNLLLIPRAGMAGAALAVTVAYMLQLITACYFFFRWTKLPLHTLFGLRSTLAEMLQYGRDRLYRLQRAS